MENGGLEEADPHSSGLAEALMLSRVSSLFVKLLVALAIPLQVSLAFIWLDPFPVFLGESIYTPFLS